MRGDIPEAITPVDIAFCTDAEALEERSASAATTRENSEQKSDSPLFATSWSAGNGRGVEERRHPTFRLAAPSVRE